MTTERVDLRAPPVGVSGEDAVANERRFRAGVERAFLSVDNFLQGLTASVRANTGSFLYDPTGVQSWRIDGSTLHCFGKATLSGGVVSITFLKTFEFAPSLQVSIEEAAVPLTEARTAWVSGVSATGATLNGRQIVGGVASASAASVMWHAIGKLA